MLISRRSIKHWYWLHKWSSLICTLFMLLLCLTGLPLIFADEIDHALGYSAAPPQTTATAARADLDQIISDAERRSQGHAVQFLVGDADEPNLWHVRLGASVDAEEASAFYSYDARSGGFLQAYPLERNLTQILLGLHVDLFAGLPGMLFLGFMGLLLIVSLVSGTLIYGIYMRKLPFGTVRYRRSATAKWLDLHNLLGIATLVWFTVVAATGVLNTLSIPIFDHWQNNQLAAMIAPYGKQGPRPKQLAVGQAVAAALQSEPDMTLSFLAFPGNSFAAPRHFVAFMQGNTALTSQLLKPLLIEATSGTVVARGELPAYVSVLLLSRPLHFGDYGGLPLKIIWAVLDGIAIVVLISGIILWFRKRHLSFETRFRLTD